MSVDDQDDAEKWRKSLHQMTVEDAEKWRRVRPRSTPKEGGGIWTTTSERVDSRPPPGFGAASEPLASRPGPEVLKFSVSEELALTKGRVETGITERDVLTGRVEATPAVVAAIEEWKKKVAAEVAGQVADSLKVMGTKTNNDPVSNSSHYTSGDVECIDAVRAQLSEEGFKAFLHGTIVTYMWRWDKKAITDEGKAEDLRKALWYLNRLYKAQGGK